MKGVLVLRILVLLALLIPVQAQRSVSKTQRPYRPTEYEPHRRVMVATDDSGRVVSKYTELKTGGYKQIEDGTWIECSDEVEVFEGGAVARKTRHQVIFSPSSDPGRNRNADPAVFDILFPEGQGRIRGQCVGLAYTEKATGRSVWIAEMRDVPGEVVGRNEVIYPDCFADGISGDLRYRVTLGGIAQDVILRSDLPPPADYGLGDSDLEIWTELFEFPAAQKEILQRVDGPGRVVRDCFIDFGGMNIRQGRAFPISDDKSAFPANRAGHLPVTKEYENLGGLQFIIEKVNHADIAPHLVNLPPPAQAAVRNAEEIRLAFQRSDNAPETRPDNSMLVSQSHGMRQALPAKLGNGSSPLNDLLSPLELANFWKERSSSDTDMAISSELSRRPKPEREIAGYVLDWDLEAGSLTDFHFEEWETYVVLGRVDLYGTTIMDPCVIKYAPSVGAVLVVNGALQMRSEQYRPVVFCASDDDSIGSVVDGSTGTPDGYYGDAAIIHKYGSATTFSNLRVNNMGTGLYVETFFSTATNVLMHAQFVDCYYGAHIYGGTRLEVRNALFYQNIDPLGFSGGSMTAEHVTINKCYGRGSATFTNSLFVELDVWGSISGSHNVTNLYEEDIFQHVGDAKHYLRSDVPYHDTATTNINASLLASLKQRTTFPPTTGSIGGDNDVLSLTPHVYRDIDSIPSHGYHYDPIDYVLFSGGTNREIVIQPGTVIGATGGDPGSLGMAGGKLTAHGTASSPIRFVRSNAVQEQATRGWVPDDSPSQWHLLLLYHENSSPPPQLSFKFTEWTMPDNNGSYIYIWNNNTNGSIDISHSRFIGNNLFGGWYPPSLYITNCFFDRMNIGASYFRTPVAKVRNSTFYKGYVSINEWATNASFYDNFFDQCTVYLSSAPTNMAHNYNAYQTGYNRLPTAGGYGANDVILSSAMSYASGTFGKYYQTVTNLVGRGSTSSTNLGLYHFTLQSSEAKEAATTVDIGYHYVAGASGAAVDSDSDGIPDYLEDADGDGALDSGETRTDSASDPGFAVRITEPTNNSVIP